MSALPSAPASARMHWPSLAVALLVMVVGSVHPLMLAGPDGQADHALAMAWFWAMSAGLVRGVGFIPRARPVRWLLGGSAVTIALGLAVWLRWGG
mgnify:CR=1 FL=1